MITFPGSPSDNSDLNRALREQKVLQIRTETYSNHSLHIVMAFENERQRDRINELILRQLMNGRLSIQINKPPRTGG